MITIQHCKNLICIYCLLRDKLREVLVIDPEWLGLQPTGSGVREIYVGRLLLIILGVGDILRPYLGY